ncbi:hypothetical protein Agub_g15355, partial [Astrephomene gubernaculifera]
MHISLTCPKGGGVSTRSSPSRPMAAPMGAHPPSSIPASRPAPSAPTASATPPGVATFPTPASSPTIATTHSNNTIPSTQPTAATAAMPIDFLSVRGVLFDVDGTLVESDPLHFKAFQEILVELGFQGGRPIDLPFFRAHISGRHNPEIAADLFPEWEEGRRVAFYEDKEERFRRLAAGELEPLEGLREFMRWLRARGVATAAVTNAPRANAEMMIRAIGLEGGFQHLVLGEECVRAKPHPDPY